MNLQFPRYVAAMGYDGVHRDAEVIGNLLVAHALHQTHDNILLTLSESLRTVGILGNHVRDFRRHIVLLHAFLKAAYGRNEDVVLHLRMKGEPLLVVVDVVERRRKLVVVQSVAGQIFYDDALQLAQLCALLSMML